MRKGAFLENRAETASFALRGKGRYRIATVFPDHIYLFLRENCYVGGAAERDKFVEELKAESFLEQDLDPSQVKDGRNLSQMLATLSVERIERLLGILIDEYGKSHTIRVWQKGNFNSQKYRQTN
jgi:hypothetical protein